LRTEGVTGLLDQGYRGFGTSHVVDRAPSGDFHEQGSAVGRQKVWRRRIETERTAQSSQTSKGEAAQLERVCHKQLILGSSAYGAELE
jgi:hypothetical protein